MKNHIIILGVSALSCQEVQRAIEGVEKAAMESVEIVKESTKKVKESFDKLSVNSYELTRVAELLNEKLILNDLKDNKDKIYSGLKKYRNVRRL